MDNSEYINTVEWFFGYGGNHLGIKRVLPNLRLIAACEIEAYAVANYTSKMEKGRLVPCPTWTDCKTFPAEPFKGGIVDLFIASYPCQPFSAAGKRQGKDDPRHLWPYVRKFIKETKPKLCFFENVEGHVSLGLREVLTDLVKLGYRVENDCGEPAWGLFSAAEVGAPHRRKRVFILAHSGLLRQEKQKQQTAGVEQPGEELADPRSAKPNRIPEPEEWWEDRTAGNSSAELGNSAVIRQQGHRTIRKQVTSEPYTQEEFISCSSENWPARPGHPQFRWEEPRVLGNTSEQGLPIRVPRQMGNSKGTKQEFKRSTDDCERKIKPQLGRATSRSSSRMDANRIDRLRLLGNGVVPATAEKAFRTLYGRITDPKEYIQPSIQLTLFEENQP